MDNNDFSQSRRNILTALPSIALLGATGFSIPADADLTVPDMSTIVGPVTYYAEMRVAQLNKPGFDAGVQHFAQSMLDNGALAVTLKQMVGDSTMVKNYPESYKGVLRNAYADGAQAGTLPLFYSLFVRFNHAGALHQANADRIFDREVMPHLHGAMMKNGKLLQTPQPVAVYRGVFETLLAGDRHGIYTQHEDLLRFLRHPVDNNMPGLLTVENHVFVDESTVPAFDQAVPALLKVAQETMQPVDGTNPLGLPGAQDNLNYRKAVSTEILRKVDSDGQLRAYVMHGVWESVWDHENSHIDPRFKAAAGPVGALVVIGPVEPFYSTQATWLKA